MEESPLGRTEWIKFEAAFLGKDSIANVIFSKIESNYNSLCIKVQKTTQRPTVFCEKKTGDSWYIAGGKSYMGNFLKDAGAKYLWADLKNSGSVPLSFEKVFAKAIHADFWLFKYNNIANNTTITSLANEYELYKNFDALKNNKVFAVNSAKSPFYEQGPMEPDIVLADLVHIFHPELLPDYKPRYYFQLKSK
jgi:iron complex transport system substrate-binding protein